MKRARPALVADEEAVAVPETGEHVHDLGEKKVRIRKMVRSAMSANSFIGVRS
jgi:hypothetical protein